MLWIQVCEGEEEFLASLFSRSYMLPGKAHTLMITYLQKGNEQTTLQYWLLFCH